MPHHKSAEKRLRQTVKRTIVNRARMSRVRTFDKPVGIAIESGDQSAQQNALPCRAAGRHVIKVLIVARCFPRHHVPPNKSASLAFV